MKLYFIALIYLVFNSQFLPAKDTVTQGKKGVVIIESEATSSSLGKWKKKTSVVDFTGECHLEFTGNNTASGKPNSPLKYKFTVDKDGNYSFFIRGYKRLTGDDGKKEKSDRCNDCFIRLEGDYESGSEIDKQVLENDQKFYIHGKSDVQWDWAKTMEYHHPKDRKQNGKKPPVYKLKTGETYTLIISGRSQRFNMDKIVFLHSDVNAKQALEKASK